MARQTVDRRTFLKPAAAGTAAVSGCGGQSTRAGGAEPSTLARLRSRLSELLAAAHDDFRPGTGYGEWYDDRRNLVRTGLGPVPA